MAERRVIGLFVPAETILGCVIHNWTQPYDVVVRSFFGADDLPLPEDARLLRVDHDIYRDGFVFVLEHESFPLVPVGGEFEVWTARHQEMVPVAEYLSKDAFLPLPVKDPFRVGSLQEAVDSVVRDAARRACRRDVYRI